MNVKFYCRASKADKNGLAPVEIALTVEGNRIILPLPRREKPSEFKRDTSCRKNTDIKNYLAAVRLNVGKAITEITESGQPLDTNILKEYMKYGGIRKHSVAEVFEDFLAMIKPRLGVSMGQQQYKKYQKVRDIFYEVIEPDKPITAVNSGVVEQYISRLSTEYSPATIATMCTRLKAVTSYAMGQGYLKTNPFNMVKVKSPKPREEWLSDGELDRIRNLELKNPELIKAKELFLFQCATGISYADLRKLTPEDIIMEGSVWSVRKTRTKTGIRYTSVILPEGQEILRKWNFKVPVKSSQKYNLGLLKIETMAGIQKHLHSHLGRKVYGTTLLRGGVSMKAVSKSLGHSNSSITESTYAFLQSEDVIREISSKMCV